MSGGVWTEWVIFTLRGVNSPGSEVTACPHVTFSLTTTSCVFYTLSAVKHELFVSLQVESDHFKVWILYVWPVFQEHKLRSFFDFTRFKLQQPETLKKKQNCDFTGIKVCYNWVFVWLQTWFSCWTMREFREKSLSAAGNFPLCEWKSYDGIIK